MFVIYKTDIVRDIQSSIRLFADGTTLYIHVIVDLPDSAALILNDDLELISLLSDLWLVNLNPNKSGTFLCSRKRNRVNHPNLHLANIPVMEVSSHKYLRLHF